ncbi:MAG: 50S ribosomal protein L1 [Candidatus Falkowbacteria bacterium GW2011_GWF2_39_8]|uniref:Large ribosomal subunit protein uL1 n=1 Tax=Candidatus Falkowbacteria bacterium GW2011_GWF2_39_8 TaxID=1618642 RepID=A0A0G0Q080_9BACT|nr:MAG: 50S ribosomal protein L1 [Candidatus Falkowbacteria bacterium GW2011_GWF2_39_8]
MTTKKVKTFDYDKQKAYSLEEALEMTKKFSKTKFDASVEVHFRLGIDTKKGDQQIRSAVSLPHGIGKTVKVAAFVAPAKEAEVKAAGADIVGGEELIEEIKKSEKTDFDVAIAQPEMMRFLAPIAKILGTRGLMPSPKNETVTTDPATAVKEIKKGKISFKNDDTGNVHLVIGKTSFENQKLIENFTAVVDLIKKVKPNKSKGVYIKNVSITSTMGPGIKVSL